MNNVNKITIFKLAEGGNNGTLSILLKIDGFVAADGDQFFDINGEKYIRAYPNTIKIETDTSGPVRVERIVEVSKMPTAEDCEL